MICGPVAMASGKTHATIATGAMLLGVVGLTLAGDRIPPAPALGAQAGLIMGWLVSPDADQEGSNYEEQRWQGVPIIGWFLYLALRMVWLPYAMIIPHRSLWSHGILLGTLGRMAYVALILWLIPPARPWISWLMGQPVLLWGLIMGWAVQDALHIALDLV